ncbi:hypothetical protein ACJJTC_011156 [Scirpophaga incertulas]
MKLIIVLCLCVKVLCINDFGPPAGYMSDCPGMNRTTKLSAKTRNSLTVVALKLNPGGFLPTSEVRCSLGDSGRKCVADHMDLTKTVQVLISGYLDSTSSILVRSMATQYLNEGSNLLLVEIFPVLVRAYPLAARLTKPFGMVVGEFIASLTEFGLTADRLQLMGASLGAHISHYAAVRFYELTGTKPARLTGLDPAGPCFRHLPEETRINANGARKVDIVHTNIDGFGIADPVGHVDFYLNGGEYQQSIKQGVVFPCLELCSHIRSALYLMYSYINPDKFIGIKCDSVRQARTGNCYESANLTTNLLGPLTDFTKPGIYYLPTNEKAPYYRGRNAFKRRKYGIATYLLQVSPDKDIVI